MKLTKQQKIAKSKYYYSPKGNKSYKDYALRPYVRKRRREISLRWYYKHRDEVLKRCRMQKRGTNYRRNKRITVLNALGNRCKNPKCKWLNDDGTLGCTDIRILQIDHKKGGGHREHKELGHCTAKFYNRILLNKRKYQLLCPNCNWIKRWVNKEWKRK